MFGKGSKLYSILKFKCPKCHEGDLYKSDLASLEGIYNMHKRCPHCDKKYEIEPGFWWGAMYIGYMFSSAYMLGTMGILVFLVGITVNQAFIWAIVGAVIVVPLFSRLSRAVWINIYVHYDANTKKKSISS